jgi:hypothetical protein
MHCVRDVWEQLVLYFTLGSAGPRRFKLPIAVGRLRIREGKLPAEILILGD